MLELECREINNVLYRKFFGSLFQKKDLIQFCFICINDIAHDYVVIELDFLKWWKESLELVDDYLEKFIKRRRCLQAKYMNDTDDSFNVVKFKKLNIRLIETRFIRLLTK